MESNWRFNVYEMGWGYSDMVMAARVLGHEDTAIAKTVGPGAANRWLLFNFGGNLGWVVLDQYQTTEPFPYPYLPSQVEPDEPV